MPRARAAPAAAVPVAQDDDEDEETEAQLQFSDPLSWQVGKAIPTGELLKRLQALATELKEAEQETISKESLTRPAQELAHSNLLKHKDKGVKSWAAHCLVDVLRLAAPNAPFSGQQLKDIFTLFVSHSIYLLADSSDAYHSQHYYVLQNLLSTKAIVLVTDIHSANSLVLALFATTFDILAQPSDTVSKNVEYQLTGLLQCLVDECQSLPSEAVDILLAQFLRADPRSRRVGVGKGKRHGQVEYDTLQQSMLPSKQLPPAYNVAQSVCNSCVDRMSRYVSHYFSSVIIDASNFAAVKSASKSGHRSHEDSDEEDGGQAKGPSKDDLDQLRKTHLLLRELWKACPGVLHTVIPQVETELSADNVELRRLATEAFGDMAAGIGVEASLQQPVIDPVAYPPKSLRSATSAKASPDGSRVPKASLSFAHTHIAAYQSFLGRRNDKASEVRAAWTLAIGRILTTSAGGLGLGVPEEQSLINDLSQMLVDGDEKVRQAAVQALGYLEIEDFVSKIGSFQHSSNSAVTFMDRLSQRSREISALVRSDASQFIGKLWGASAHEIALGDEQVIELLGQIPSKILSGIYLNRPDITALIDRVMFESLIPLGYPTVRKKDKPALQHGNVNGDIRELSDQDADKIRVERILLLYKGLDEKARNALLSVMSRPTQMSSYAKTWLKTCEDYNGGVMDQNEKETKKKLSSLIGYFAKLLPDAVRASEDLWRFAKIHDRRCYALIRFCVAEDSDYRRIQKSIKELMKRLGEAPGATSTVSETIMSLLYRMSSLFYNKSHLRPIIDISSQDGHALATAAQEVLKEISQRAPGIFKAHGQELCRLVESSAPTKTRTNDHGATDALKACATFARRYPQEVPKEKSFNQAMIRYVLHGTPAAAKYATSIILWSSDKKEMHAKALLKACIDNLEFGTDNYVSKLAALSQLMLLNATNMDVQSEIDPILRIAIKDIYLQPLSPAFAETPEVAEAQLELDAKCWALKILTNRLRAYSSAEAVQEIYPQIYKLLTNLLGEEPDPETSTPLARASHARLRLQAALLHLKLASHEDFDTLLTADAFNFLCLIAQDSESQHIRQTFITKVKKFLGQERLRPRFYTIIFLLAFEPAKRLKHDSSVWLRARATYFQKAQRNSIEHCFNRFLSILAHHPDFSDNEDYLPDLVTYIMFYLTSVSNASTLSLIYHIAQTIKSVRDGITTADEDENAIMSHNLYYLSDLSLMVINAYAGAHNWTLQAYSGKTNTPSGVFATMRTHKEAQAAANTQFLSSDAAESVERLVRQALRKGKAEKKRKSDGELDDRPAKRRDVSATSKENGNVNGADGHSRAKAKPKSADKALAALKKSTTKTPRKSRSGKAGDESEIGSDVGPRLAPESADRRQSSRAKGRKSYAEAGDNDDDEEMEEWQEGTSMGSEKENRRTSAR